MNRIQKLMRSYKIPLEDVRAVCAMARVVRASGINYDFGLWIANDASRSEYSVYCYSTGSVKWGCQSFLWREINALARAKGWCT